MRKRNSMKKIVAYAVSATMVLGAMSPAVFAEEETEIAAEVLEDSEVGAEGAVTASGEKWTATETADGWIEVVNDGGETLGYSPDSGVTLIEDDGYAFKDLDKDGELDVYEDWRLTPEERTDDLVSQMTLYQKSALRLDASVSSLGSDEEEPAINSAEFYPMDMTSFYTAVTEYGFLNYTVFPLAYGLADCTDVANFTNRAQAMAEEGDFGIPLALNADLNKKFEAGMSNTAMAASFDPDLVSEITQETSKILRACGITMIHGPQLDLYSDPRSSMFSEDTSGSMTGSFGGDPALSRDMANAYISGMQSTYDENGEDLGWGEDSVVTMMKHFAANFSSEFGRNYHSTEGAYTVFPGDSFDTQLVPFIDGALNLDSATGKSGAVMVTYTAPYSDDGSYGDNLAGAVNGFLIGTLKDYGFDGIVSTDGLLDMNMLYGIDGAAEMSAPEQLSLMFAAGVDQVMAVYNITDVVDAYDILAEEYGEEFADENYDHAAYATLIPLFRMGIFENPYVSEAYATEISTNSIIASTVTNEYTEKGIVMLKNNGIIAENAGAERQTVYVPMVYSTSSNTWNLPISEDSLAEYYDIVTDTVGDPTGEEGAYTVDDIIRASADELAACDFSLVVIYSPFVGSAYDSETETWIPLSIQYSDYTADSEYVRTESISGETVETVIESPYGDVVSEEKENTAYFGESTTTANSSDMDTVIWVAENTDVPMVLCINACSSMVFSEIEEYADAIFMGFGLLSNDNYLPLISGEIEPSALLPFGMPASMEAVEAQLEDVPRDEEDYVDANGNTYEFGFGMNWSGVIDDERVAQYKVEPLSGLESQPAE